MSLERIEVVLDALPRAQGARVVEAGGFAIFVREGPGWPWYARPAAPPHDLAAARAALREHGAPEVFEWVHDLHPDLLADARAAGLTVARHPLLVLREPADLPPPAGARFADAPLEDVLIAQAEAFGGGADMTHLDVQRQALAEGRNVLVAAVDDAGEVLGAGMVQRAAGGAELVGIATIERFRRRGLAAALVAELARRVADDDPVFLSAGSDATARVYERAGFVRVGSTCAAEPVS